MGIKNINTTTNTSINTGSKSASQQTGKNSVFGNNTTNPIINGGPFAKVISQAGDTGDSKNIQFGGSNLSKYVSKLPNMYG